MTATRGRRLVVAGLLVAAMALLPLPATAIDLLPPVGVADTLTMVHDRVAVVPPPGVLGNDLDLDGGATAVLDSNPTHGTVTLRSDGGYTYTPHAGYVGTDEFWYHATSLLLNSLTTPVTITITNTVPVAVADAYAATAGEPLVVPAPGVLRNDVDADGDALIAEVVTGVAHGTLSLSRNGAFTYTAVATFAGADGFTYRAWDGVAWSVPAAVALTVSLPPLPLPTPTPTVRPTPAPTPTPSPVPSDARPSPSESPVPGGPVSGGPGATPAPATDPFALPPVQIDPFDDRLGGFDAFGGFEWAIPALVLAVPGLLLIVALLAQAAIGVVWLPMVRRHLAGVGLRRRRQSVGT